MSEFYPPMSEVELSALIELESGINHLANEFQNQSALNFYHESEIAAYLMARLRNSPHTHEYINNTCMHLAHLEWPCLESRFIDLVIWRQGVSQQAIKLWGNRGKCARNLPLLAAVQIKRGPGKISSLSSTIKDLIDLKSLYQSGNLQKPVLYFLEFVDHGLQAHRNDREEYRGIKDTLDKWCGETQYGRALLISRDNVGFAYPKGLWLTDPLPDGTTENLG